MPSVAESTVDIGAADGVTARIVHMVREACDAVERTEDR
jgi:hypothetical protein